jgi:hypothetical protein
LERIELTGTAAFIVQEIERRTGKPAMESFEEIVREKRPVTWRSSPIGSMFSTVRIDHKKRASAKAIHILDRLGVERWRTASHLVVAWALQRPEYKGLVEQGRATQKSRHGQKIAHIHTHKEKTQAIKPVKVSDRPIACSVTPAAWETIVVEMQRTGKDADGVLEGWLVGCCMPPKTSLPPVGPKQGMSTMTVRGEAAMALSELAGAYGLSCSDALCRVLLHRQLASMYWQTQQGCREHPTAAEQKQAEYDRKRFPNGRLMEVDGVWIETIYNQDEKWEQEERERYEALHPTGDSARKLSWKLWLESQ